MMGQASSQDVVEDLVRDMFESFGNTPTASMCASYARRLIGFRIGVIEKAVAALSAGNRPPSVHRIVEQAKAIARAQRIEGDTLTEQLARLRAHPLYRTIPVPRPYGYPSDVSLVQRGVDSIKVYNAISAGQYRVAGAIDAGLFDKDRYLQKYPPISDDEARIAFAEMRKLGLRPPPWVDQGLIARAFWHGSGKGKWRGRCKTEPMSLS